MTTDQQTAIYSQAIKTFGPEKQMIQVIEECSELTTSIVHHLRGRSHNMAEEVADVEIMIAQLRMMIGDGPVDQAKEQKLIRLADRLAGVES